MKPRQLHKKRGERGVALLFAIGLLSLMIMLGVSFSMESLQSQKNAANNSNRSAAKVLAQSAINHVSTAILRYSEEYWYSDNAPFGDGIVSNILPTDFTVIVSRGGNSDVSKNDKDNLTTEKKLLSFRTPYIGKYYGGEKAKSAGETSYEEKYDVTSKEPQWVYVKSNKVESGETKDSEGNTTTTTVEPLVGRFAYRVLPPASSTQINYSYYVNGNQRISGGAGNALANDISFVGNVLAADSSFLTAASLDFYAAYKKITKKDFDLATRFFCDGAVPGDIEVFKIRGTSGKNYYCHRYNLTGAPVVTGTSDDEKVSSLIDKAEAQKRISFFSFKDLVDEKKATSTTSNNIDRSYYQEKNLKNAEYKSNLFFLGMIAKNEASFENLNTRRKQIAANFLDYCDENGVPTSDSTNWADNAPSYTGNERTLYINEIAFLSKISAAISANGATGIDVKLIPGMAAELIKIYDTVKIKDTLISDMSDSAVVGKLNCEITNVKVNFSGEAKIKSDSTPRTEPIETSVDFGNVKFSGSKAVSFKKSNGKNGYYAALSDGYLTGANESKAKNASIERTVSVPNLVTGETVESFELKATSIDITFKKSLYLESGDINVDCAKLPSDAPQTVTLTMENPLTQTNQDVYFTIGNMSVKDPRQNLNINTAYSKATNTGSDWKKSDWVFDPVAVVNSTEIDGCTMDIEVDPTSLLASSVDGRVNKYSSPKGAYEKAGGEMNVDLESVDDPAYTNSERISTAYIRNGNMKSMWELGLIHRGAAWETINLQGSSVTPEDLYKYLNGEEFAGTAYEDGDAGILDTVKISNYAINWGMIDVNMFRKTYPGYDYTGENTDAKFYVDVLMSLVKHKDPETSDEGKPIFEQGQEDTVRANFVTNVFKEVISELERRSQVANLYDGVFSKDDFPTDSSREELIGKLMPLIKTDPALVTVFHVDIVAQTIKDIGGIGEDLPVSKMNSQSAMVSGSARLGRFDKTVSGSETVYFDEITGQVKLRATFDYNPFTGKVKLRQIKYLD